MLIFINYFDSQKLNTNTRSCMQGCQDTDVLPFVTKTCINFFLKRKACIIILYLGCLLLFNSIRCQVFIYLFITFKKRFLFFIYQENIYTSIIYSFKLNSRILELVYFFLYKEEEKSNASIILILSQIKQQKNSGIQTREFYDYYQEVSLYLFLPYNFFFFLDVDLIFIC